MKVARHLRQLKTELRDLLQRPLKELVVVGLEMDLPALFQHLPVFLQEISMGQPALFLVAFRPRIAEIDVKAIHFTGGEKHRQKGGVGVEKEHVFQTLRRYPLHGHHHGVRHFFHGDEQRVRLRLSGAGCEATLAAAQLHLQTFGLRIKRPPVPPQPLRIADPAIAAGVHAGLQIFLFAHTHDGFPPKSCPDITPVSYQKYRQM